jgi:hypothetical protein
MRMRKPRGSEFLTAMPAVASGDHLPSSATALDKASIVAAGRSMREKSEADVPIAGGRCVCRLVRIQTFLVRTPSAM